MTAALSHIRVLDLSRVLAGPWCTQNLADLGAEVIKVEKPGSGDDTRAWGPPWLRDAEGRDTGESAYFLSCNRGKKSLALDIAHPAGSRIVRELARHCDVLVENFKVGGLAKYGLDWDSLHAINPRLVYCSITGFGQDGPYAERPGYDFIVQGMGGLMSVTGERDDAPGGGPQKVGVAVADLFTGMYATVAVLAALTFREQSGQGQRIDLALLDAQVAMLANQNMNFLVSGQAPMRLGNAHPNIVPYQTFATSDGHLILAVGNDAQFRRFCELAGCAELADDARFASNPARVAHRTALIPLLEPILRSRTTLAWIGALEAAGVPCGPINRLNEVFDDPQVRHRGLRIDLPHPTAGNLAQVASPIRLSATPPEYASPPPLLGQHTNEILQELLGFPEEERARLREMGVIA
ncbi:MAG: CoA transferase [Rhodocyclaceae bacterium]|jgi:formyl-CoA transferase|nr:Acetyl-CoA:oxalate CoA-transferase [Rhodocyclaceae bacterium]MCC6879547.1 CoA transferase [Rhodocyclaceae bacterium]